MIRFERELSAAEWSSPALVKTSHALSLTLAFLVADATTVAGTSPSIPPAPPAATSDTIIVLDASGSMNERIHGETKIAIARRAVHELIASLPDTTRIGLVAYSHRRNSCDDIELLIAPGPLDRTRFITAVDGLQPKGRTPLTAALEFTAQALDFTNHPANIILVSDGLETCGGDPCATADRLARTGAGLVIHTVAFDLSAKDAASFACIAAATKGRFLQANDAASLKDALVVAVAEATTPIPAAPPAEDLSAAKLELPNTVAAGATFSVTWSGPNNNGDFITIVPKGAPDGATHSLAYTRMGRALTLTALIDAGDAEVRYITGRSHLVLGRATIKVTPVTVTLSAAEEAIAGANVSVAWTGPNNDGDFLTIMPTGTPDGGWSRTVQTRSGSPATLIAPIDAGDAEIRYLTGEAHKVLARRPIKIVAATITLHAPSEVIAGSEVSLTWTGPANPNDFITIMPKGSPDGSWSRTSYTRQGSPLKVFAPITPGEAEIRYHSGNGYKVLARQPITIKAARITLTPPEQASAGQAVAIAWTGPNNVGDYLTVVPRDANDNVHGAIAYARAGSPAKLTAPANVGPVEVRYLNGYDNRVLARAEFSIVTP